MPAPTTVDEFVDLVRKSSVLDEPRLSGYVQKLKADPATPADLNAIAGLFVRDGLLTYFQAEQFLQGRWKRFTIGKYKVLERLGSGGMGQVFLCEHKLMRRRVAVKVLPTAKATDPSSLERFYREARAVAALDHPNIVRAYDIDQDDNLHFLVMEYVDGASLQEMIRKTGAMDVTRACHYMYWSAVGLQHAHVNGLIHRDIKPGNILVDRQGVVKILDLGLARFFNDDQDLLTKKYDESVLGTADYLAPEQAIDSHTVDGRADIYSLGATFYFLLSGNPPFADGTVAQKLLWHQTRAPRAIREHRPEVPEAVAAVLDKMMSKKPADRYQTPAQLAEALLPFTQTPIPPPPDAEMPQLSVAALSPPSGPITVSSTPRSSVAAPKTPPPMHGPRTPATPSPVAVADAETRRTPPTPVVEPIPDSNPGTGPNWEAISADTANAARADTERTRREGKSSRRIKPKTEEVKPPPPRSTVKRKPTRRANRLPIALAIVGAAVLLLSAAFAAYWFGFRDTKKPPGPNGGENRRLVLTRSPAGAPYHYTSLKDALAEFRPGDQIVIQDEVWEETASVSGTKGLVLTPAEGKRVVWRAPPNKGSQALLSLYNTDGARIAGITFQAGYRSDHGVRVHGQCPGLVLENLEFADASVAGLAVHDCDGAKGRPVTVRKCRFTNAGGKESRYAVLVTSAPIANPKGGAGVPGSQEVVIQDCVVEGPFAGAAFEFEGSATGLVIRNCRIWKAQHGVQFKKPRPEVIWRVDLVGNTFHTLTGAAIKVDDIGPMRRPETRVGLTQNFFTATPVVAQIDGDASGTQAVFGPEGNFRKRGVQAVWPAAPAPAAALIPSTETDADVAANPADPAHFLTYDRANPLFTAFGGKPVGAPPND
jgi:eukaryotic-like serine/threonine-protein kinase